MRTARSIQSPQLTTAFTRTHIRAILVSIVSLIVFTYLFFKTLIMDRLIKKRCKICHQLKSKFNMAEHLRCCKLTSDFIEFNAGEEHAYKCLYCEKSFQTRMSAVRHFGSSHKRHSALKLEK